MKETGTERDRVRGRDVTDRRGGAEMVDTESGSDKRGGVEDKTGWVGEQG